MNYRRIATFTGWLWIITFVTSIPARFWFYAPVLDNEGNYVRARGMMLRRSSRSGHCSNSLLIISNVGTAVVPYSIHKRVHEAGAVEGSRRLLFLKYMGRHVSLSNRRSIATLRNPSATSSSFSSTLEALTSPSSIECAVVPV